jgi:hypothetical protein
LVQIELDVGCFRGWQIMSLPGGEEKYEDGE